MRGGRGQVTVYVLVGLVLLIILILIFVLARRLGQEQPIPQGYDAKAVQGHIERCMDLVSEDAFQKLGAQGGRLYTDQGGSHNRAAGVAITPDGGGAPVTVGFGLQQDSGFPLRPCFPEQYYTTPGRCIGTFVAGTEHPYPMAGVTLDQLYPTNLVSSFQHLWHEPRYDGAFGQDSLTLPCELGGANTMNGTFTCEAYLHPLPSQETSVQESLSTFFVSALDTCIDEDELAALLGTAVRTTTPNVTVTYTKTETIVTVDLPLRFADEQGNYRTSYFTRRYPLRTYELFAFAHALLDRASKDPFFRLNRANHIEDFISTTPYSNFVVTQAELPPSQTAGRQDLHLVTIRDSQSTVDKGTWFLNFLVQSRPPVLPYTAPLSIEQGTAYSGTIDIIDPDGNDLDINLALSGAPADFQVMIFPAPPDPSIMFDYFISLIADGSATIGTATYNLSVIEQGTGLQDWQLVDITITAPLP